MIDGERFKPIKLGVDNYEAVVDPSDQEADVYVWLFSNNDESEFVMFITPDEAREFAAALVKAAGESER